MLTVDLNRRPLVPLFAFCVLGLHTVSGLLTLPYQNIDHDLGQEILCLWFPCIRRPRKLGVKEIVGENSAPMVDTVTHPSNNSEATAQYLPVDRSENGDKSLASV